MEKSWTSRSIGGIFDCRIDEQFTLIHAEEALYRLLGYTQEEFEHEELRAMLSHIHVEDRKALLDELHQPAVQRVHMFENRLYCRDGSIKWVWISIQEAYSQEYGAYYHCIFHDISEDKELKQSLEISKKRLAFVLEQTQDIVFEYDFIKNEIFYSDNFLKKFGYSIPRKGFPDSMFEKKIVYEDDVALLRNGFQSIIKGKPHMEREYRLRYRNSGYRWVKVYATGLRDEDDHLIDILGVIIDIHEQKQEILKSRQEAALDPLTGLFNRRECIRRLNTYIALEEDLMAFILIDLDDFKMINDSMGHNAGDRTLRSVGDVLRSLTRAEDIVARIGGDEFVICLLHLPDRQVALHKVESIQNLFATHLKEQLGHVVNCSIGISFYPEHGNDFTVLMENADQAMYRAKQEGKNSYQIHKEGNADLPLSNPLQYMKKHFRDHVVDHMLQILSESNTCKQAVLGLLEMVGAVLHSDRSLIYQRNGHVYQLLYAWVSDDIYRVEDSTFPFIAQVKNSSLFHHDMLAIMNLNELEEGDLKQWFQERNSLASIIFLRTLKESEDIMLCFEDCHSVREISGEARYSLLLVVKVIMLLMQKECYQPNALKSSL